MGNGPPGVGVGEDHYSPDVYPKPPAAASNIYGPLHPFPPLDSSNLPPVPRNWRSPSPHPIPIPATPTIIPPSSTASIYTTNSPTATLTGGHLSPRPAPTVPGNITHHRRRESLAENIMPPPLPPMSERSSSGGSTTLHGSGSEHSLISPPSTAGHGAQPPPQPYPQPQPQQQQRRRDLTLRRKSVPPPEESHLLSQQGGGGGGGADEGPGGQYYW
ncbi:hypothetical protein BZA05DRAFT_388503 [Tricharina praecox]|uniref:uncharacterized protein n=1 Tax=Tricharina praecox TaxID=43433 RepID=UPI0022210A66|nr:uncharacterized protein BZA05DRAFT_388503 [Tricharina praecox]KAI5856445.1 hypothetical protein BZA05DRAFT_388503 [Tricharina praecox]